jgi:hypothetical protein
MKHTWTDREADILHDFRLLFGEWGCERGLGWKNQARPPLTAQARLSAVYRTDWQLLLGDAERQPPAQRKEVSIPRR